MSLLCDEGTAPTCIQFSLWGKNFMFSEASSKQKISRASKPRQSCRSGRTTNEKPEKREKPMLWRSPFKMGL